MHHNYNLSHQKGCVYTSCKGGGGVDNLIEPNEFAPQTLRAG